MDWLVQNGLTVLLMAAFLLMVLRGPILGRVYGVEQITVHDLAARLGGQLPVLLLDVRTPMEFAGGFIAGARNIPLSSLSAEMNTLKNQHLALDVCVICRSGARSLNGAIAMKRAGFSKVYNVSGGMLQWVAQGFAVRK